MQIYKVYNIITNNTHIYKLYFTCDIKSNILCTMYYIKPVRLGNFVYENCSIHFYMN